MQTDAPYPVKYRAPASVSNIGGRAFQKMTRGILGGSERSGLVAHNIGIITPYRKQVDKIRLLLTKFGLTSALKVRLFGFNSEGWAG
jgi:hypothetical protein